MPGADYTDFFIAAAGAAGALIGLLFVAVSVAVGRLTDQRTALPTQVRASAALLAFSNVLITSLTALIPDTGIGWTSTVIGLIGVLFALASGRALYEAVPGHRGIRGIRSAGLVRSLGLIVLLIAVFGGQMVVGIIVLARGNGPGSASMGGTLAALLVASVVVGIARSWEMVGLRGTSVSASLRTLVRGEEDIADGEPTGDA